jgi:23S rRNA pseudouridine2605 synthase
MPIPLLKALTQAGFGSRRKMADAVREGRVRVNGVVATAFNHEVDTAADRVSLDGREAASSTAPAAFVYLILHKPPGVLSVTTDDRGRRTIADLVPPRYRRPDLHPVGRLDGNSTGLLLLTNDGELTHRLTHPRFEHEKEYLVTLDAALDQASIERLEKGLLLADGRTSPAVCRAAGSWQGQPAYQVVIHEGRKRQLRRMFAALDRQVRTLKRVRTGTLRLGNLPEGKARELSAAEIKELRRQAGLV